MVGEMEAKEKPKPTPDYLMQLMNDKKLMSSLPNFCGIFNHLERLLDEGERAGRAGGRWGSRPGPGGARAGGAGTPRPRGGAGPRAPEGHGGPLAGLPGDAGSRRGAGGGALLEFAPRGRAGRAGDRRALSAFCWGGGALGAPTPGAELRQLRGALGTRPGLRGGTRRRRGRGSRRAGGGVGVRVRPPVPPPRPRVPGAPGRARPRAAGLGTVLWGQWLRRPRGWRLVLAAPGGPEAETGCRSRQKARRVPVRRRPRRSRGFRGRGASPANGPRVPAGLAQATLGDGRPVARPAPPAPGAPLSL